MYFVLAILIGTKHYKIICNAQRKKMLKMSNAVLGESFKKIQKVNKNTKTTRNILKKTTENLYKIIKKWIQQHIKVKKISKKNQ